MFNKSAFEQENTLSQADIVPTPTASEKAGRGEATREQILDTAIRLFRKDGFDQTTMRQVAGEAGVALGLAYHYFPGKEALVMAYYERVQREHRAVALEKLAAKKSLSDRLSMLLQTKLDILKDDQKLLGALFRYTGNPEHPLSFLGKATAPLREDCMGLFVEALRPESLPEDLRQLLPLALWSLHMGVLLYFLYDSSPGAQRTRRLADGSVALAVSFLKLARLPLLRPARKGVMTLLGDAGLIAGVSR
jgi:AcrR family transcriptional regulator